MDPDGTTGDRRYRDTSALCPVAAIMSRTRARWRGPPPEGRLRPPGDNAWYATRSPTPTAAVAMDEGSLTRENPAR